MMVFKNNDSCPAAYPRVHVHAAPRRAWFAEKNSRAKSSPISIAVIHRSENYPID